MARKRMEDPSLKSWDEVNAALKLIRDNEIELELIEADMGKKIADIKEQAAEQAVPYRDDIKKLELQVKEFVTLNKAELKGKSREMDFGKVGFRMSHEADASEAGRKSDQDPEKVRDGGLHHGKGKRKQGYLKDL